MRTHIPYRYLFDLHDRGVVALPADLASERDALQRLIDHTLPMPASLDELHQRSVRDLTGAARSGAEMLTRVDVEAINVDTRARDAAFQALEQARHEVHGDLSQAILERRDELISNVLAPVHDGILSQAREMAPALEGADMSPVGIARAEAKTRKALTVLHDLAGDYAALRDVWGRLFELPTSTEFPQMVKLHGWVQDLDAAGVGLKNVHTTPVPWPAEQMPRLLWFAARPEVKPWLPTPAQHDAQVSTIHADGIANTKRAAWARQATREMGASVLTQTERTPA